MTDSEKLKIAVEALRLLRVAVNDKQPDPGAIWFIDKTLEQIQSTPTEERKAREFWIEMTDFGHPLSISKTSRNLIGKNCEQIHVREVLEEDE